MSFKNLEKCDILKMRKKSTAVKVSSVWLVFLSRQDKLHLKLIYNFNQNFFFQKHGLACLTKTKRRLKVNFSERQLNFCPLNYTYLGKNSFPMLLALGQK